MQPPLFKLPPHHVLTMSTETCKMQLSKLHLLFEKLPASLPTVDTISQPPSKFDFEKFELDQDWVKMTGSVVGAINRELEIRLGHGDRGPIDFRERGPPVVALVSVLDRYTCEFPGDIILTKWLDDVVEGAKHTLSEAGIPVSL